MSNKTPTLQTRSQYNRDWGNYASLITLPNGASNALAAPYFTQLEVGDTAYITGTSQKAVCTSVGTLSGANATWVAIGTGSSSPVLWQWNGTDTSQFGAPVNLGLGPNTAGLTLTTTAGGPNGTLLRASSTELGAGAVGFPVSTPLPSRYVIEIEYWAASFTDVTNAGRNACGLICIADSSLANLFAWLTLNNSTASPDAQYLGELNLSSGTPFGPGFAFNAQPMARYSRGTPPVTTNTGTHIQVTVETDRPCAADPQFTMRVLGSGYCDPITALQSTEVYGTSRDVTPGTYPAAWNGLTVDTVGIMVGNVGVTTAWTLDITGFRVLKHPADL